MHSASELRHIHQLSPCESACVCHPGTTTEAVLSTLSCGFMSVSMTVVQAKTLDVGWQEVGKEPQAALLKPLACICFEVVAHRIPVSLLPVHLKTLGGTRRGHTRPNTKLGHMVQ